MTCIILQQSHHEHHYAGRTVCNSTNNINYEAEPRDYYLLLAHSGRNVVAKQDQRTAAHRHCRCHCRRYHRSAADGGPQSHCCQMQQQRRQRLQQHHLRKQNSLRLLKGKQVPSITQQKHDVALSGKHAQYDALHPSVTFSLWQIFPGSNYLRLLRLRRLLPWRNHHCSRSPSHSSGCPTAAGGAPSSRCCLQQRRRQRLLLQHHLRNQSSTRC